MSVKGFWALRLDDYVRGADPGAITSMTDGWNGGRRAFGSAGTTMDGNATKASSGFSETMESGAAMKNSLVDSSKLAHEKRDRIRDAEDALGVVQIRIKEAMIAKAEIDSSLPESHPGVNAADFPTDAKQVGKKEAEANETGLAKAQAAHAEREAAIADAERKAAAKVQAVDASVIDADPKVRALVDPDNSRQERPSGSPTSIPGSHSDVAAARARMAKYNSGTLYPEGVGHELIAQEKANIEAYEAENKPEWNGNEWINADGTAAPATSYAMVETADGLAPLSGGAGGATALAVGAGGALLGAGVAKAIANKFGGGAARAATAGATSRSAAAKAGAAGARAGAGAGARGAGAGGRGAGARGAGAGGRGGRGGPAGAGSRAGRGGAGGAGGRGGKNKDDKQNSHDQDWQADYTDDWTDPNYKATPTVIGDEWKRRRAQQDDE